MNDHQYMNETNGTTGTGITLTGFLIGAIFGAGLALLLAPATGGETRKKLGETARRLGEKASEAVGHGREGEWGDDGSFRSDRRQDSVRSGGRQSQEPLAGGRTPQPGTPGTTT